MEFDRKGEFKWGKLEKGKEGGIGIGGSVRPPQQNPFRGNKLAKLGDAIAISKSETMNE